MKAEISSAARLLVASVAIAALASCGGGGGGGGGSTTTVPTALVQLTSANAQNVAGDATLGGLEASNNGGLASLGASVQSAQAPRTHVLSRFVVQQVERLNMYRQSPPLATGVLQPPQPCNGGGNITVDDNGSSATLMFNSCTEAGVTVSGSIAISNIAVGPNGMDFTAAVSVSLTFSATGFPPETFTGSFNISVVTSGTTTTVTLTGAQLLNQHGTNTERLASFTLVSSFDSSTGVTTDTVTFNFASTEIGGSVNVTTEVPFRTNPGRTFPSTGVLRIVGAAGSTIRVTVLGDETAPAPQVQIELDAGGDGTFETVLSKTWAELSS